MSRTQLPLPRSQRLERQELQDGTADAAWCIPIGLFAALWFLLMLVSQRGMPY